MEVRHLVAAFWEKLNLSCLSMLPFTLASMTGFQALDAAASYCSMGFGACPYLAKKSKFSNMFTYTVLVEFGSVVGQLSCDYSL